KAIRTTHATTSVIPEIISTMLVSLRVRGWRANQNRNLLPMICANDFCEVQQPRAEPDSRSARSVDVDGEAHPAVLLEQLDQAAGLRKAGRIAHCQQRLRPAHLCQDLARVRCRHEQQMAGR